MTMTTKIFRDRWMKTKRATHGEEDDDGTLRVVYHSTPVVEWNGCQTGLRVTLRNDGHATVTTKRRMNEIAEVYDLGFLVSQKDFEWSVTVYPLGGGTEEGWTLPFEDGMTIDR